MQAFEYRHLVPSQELKVAVTGRSASKSVPVTILGDMPVKIPAGGTASLKIAASSKDKAFSRNAHLELAEAPEGIIIKNTCLGNEGEEVFLFRPHYLSQVGGFDMVVPFKNNFLDNKKHAVFDIEPFSRNQWKQNFWGEPRILPKPIFGVNGSGMHTHQSLFKGKKNVFFDPKDKYHLSDVAKQYIAGLMRHAREITLFIIDAYGTDEMLSRLSDPFWFQALGCILGFDWHSSGVTTTVCGALKEGLKGMEGELGFFIAGGKGKASRKTPIEIEGICDQRAIDGTPLIYASRMSAKVDSAAVQDGYQIYHHTFFFTQSGQWAVIQQGMNEESRYARRYHWFSQGIKDFVCEPHRAVCCDQRDGGLNLVAQESKETRQAMTELSHERPEF
jgi:hypothetical protein